jgi:DNA adenine methylase
MVMAMTLFNLAKLESLNPPLKWAGGKRWLLPQLRSIWSSYSNRRMVEPFCGGLAVSLGLRPEKALLNDMNPHLINFYRWINIGLHPTIDMRNDKDLYYAHRERFNALIRANMHDTQEAAELFYYLNRTCFNGLCRFNRSGEFNVPFGKYKTINYAQDFESYKDVFDNWQLTVGSFEALTPTQDDFIYADTPYDVEFTSYSKEGFSWEDQVRLAEWLTSHQGPVVLSNQATQRIVELYQRLNFNVITIPSPRRISSNGDRTPAMEVLATRGI